jgi:hypothetical protein
MRRRALAALAPAALVLALAGCGHRSAAPGSTTTAPPPAPPAPPPPPTLTSAADRAACSDLQANIGLVSELISGSVEAMTQSLHPKQLAARTGYARKNLLISARAFAKLHAPPALRASQRELVAGLRAYAADFGRAQKSVARNDMATAAQQLADPRALAKVRASTTAISHACGR